MNISSEDKKKFKDLAQKYGYKTLRWSQRGDKMYLQILFYSTEERQQKFLHKAFVAERNQQPASVNDWVKRTFPNFKDARMTSFSGYSGCTYFLYSLTGLIKEGQ